MARSIWKAASRIAATSSSTKPRGGSASTRSRKRRCKLGLGAPTGIEMPGEKSGFIPSRAWKLKTYGVPWQQGDTLSAGIGQGYVTATPLQLALQAARIARGTRGQPRGWCIMVGSELRRREAPRRSIFPTTRLARCARA